MKKTLSLIIAALVLTTMFLPVDSNAVPFDNTFRFTGNFGLQNPCNGEITNGSIDINVVVTATETGTGETKVNVHHTSHGTLIGNLGNTYQISRHAKGKFDAIASSYVIPWTGEFVATGSAPDFTADGELRVFVNAQNEPVGSQLVGPVIRTCR